MSEGDIFREVEADMRRDQLAQYWQKFGVYIIAAAVLIVASVGGYQAWTWWQRSQAAASGSAFVQASALQEQDQRDAAAQTFSSLAEGGSGSYAALANLRLAAISAAKGDNEAAVAAYDEVAERTNDPMLRGFARIQAATLLIDTAPTGEIESRVGGMREDASPWRHSARELLALSAFNAGNSETASTLYQELLSDSETPGPMRQRAQMMLSLIDAPATGTAQAPTQ